MKKEKTSFMRRQYTVRFWFRAAVLALVVHWYLANPGCFDAAQPGQFFAGFSPIHLLWLLWMVDMTAQVIPSCNMIALGSQKIFKKHYRPAQASPAGLEAFVRRANRGALTVFLVWCALTAAIGHLVVQDILNTPELILISAVFYVCDLFCVLFFCPFKTFWMKNRCCTTCRIFNWDHLMMFTPMAFARGFYARSLFVFALAVFFAWEYVFNRWPERFWEGSNQALRCANCTDVLCGKRRGVKISETAGENLLEKSCLGAEE